MEVDLGGVPLVAGGLLKVHAVCKDLAFTLLDQDPSAYLPPAVGRAQLGEHEPLVPVQSPDDFAVSHGSSVKRIDLAPVRAPSPPSRDRIQVPIHGIAKEETAVP